jgi:hypothetical protein
MTKQQEKDYKNAFQAVESNLRIKLLDFQDRYFGAYVEWNINQIENSLLHAEKQARILPSANNNYFVERLKTRLSRKNLLTNEYISEANKGYNQKLEKLTKVLVDYGIGTRFLKVEKIRSAGGEFAFLVTNGEVEVHARAIFVNGDIKAPHYRFITTKRMIK